MASGRGGSKDAKPPYRYSRSAPTNQERFAEIHKVASRRLEPPRLRAQFWETLMRAATPPNLGGVFGLPNSFIRGWSQIIQNSTTSGGLTLLEQLRCKCIQVIAPVD